MGEIRRQPTYERDDKIKRRKKNLEIPGSKSLFVRIDKGASTPRDGILARGGEPENIRKPDLYLCIRELE
jgi:hypothetical protein